MLKKHACFRDGTILRNHLEVTTVRLDQINSFASLTHYTQGAPFPSFWEFSILWGKWINRPNSSLQTLAYDADCTKWKWEYRYQSVLATLNAFLLPRIQNNWKSQFSHPWSNWPQSWSKKVTESQRPDTFSYLGNVWIKNSHTEEQSRKNTLKNKMANHSRNFGLSAPCEYIKRYTRPLRIWIRKMPLFGVPNHWWFFEKNECFIRKDILKLLRIT